VDVVKSENAIRRDRATMVFPGFSVDLQIGLFGEFWICCAGKEEFHFASVSWVVWHCYPLRYPRAKTTCMIAQRYQLSI
jgi:hypothetical protein